MCYVAIFMEFVKGILDLKSFNLSWIVLSRILINNYWMRLSMKGRILVPWIW